MLSILVSAESSQLLVYQWRFRAAAMPCRLTGSIASTVGASHGQAGRALGTCAHHIALQQAVPEGAGDGQDAAHAPGAGPHHYPAGSLNAISLVRSVGLVVVRQLHSCMFAQPHQQALSTLCSLERAIHAAQQHACMMKTGYTGLLVHMEAYQCTQEM